MTLPSPELAAITRRWVTFMVSQKGEAMANMLSKQEPLLFCGTADTEIYRGAFLRKNYPTHVNEIPLGKQENVEIEAWENGEMGWAFWQGDIRFPNNSEAGRARVTLIFALEEGVWKIQHIHNSFPVSNVESWGYEHSAIEALLNAAQTDDPQIGKTGIASVMFTDIVDSSVLATVSGDARWTSCVQRHIGQLTHTVETNNGKMIKSLGDGSMSTFTSAAAAMRAAQAIQILLEADTTEPKLQVRIGIHTGDVVEAGDDFFGTVVNKAARIASVATGGEIRVSDATKIMVGRSDDFRFEDMARVKLKGLEGDHSVYRLTWR